MRQSDAKVSALLDETSRGAVAPAPGLTAVEHMDRIVNHAHDELDLLLLDAQAKDTAKASFPTEQRLKQKARAKAGHIAKKKPQIVEDHHDDCGEDFGPLGDDFLVTAYYEEVRLDYNNGGIYLQLDGRADPKDELRLARPGKANGDAHVFPFTTK